MNLKDKFEQHTVIFLVGLMLATSAFSLTLKEAVDAYLEKHSAKQAEMIKIAVDQALMRSEERLKVSLEAQRHQILAELRDSNEQLLAARENSALANALSARGISDGPTYRNGRVVSGAEVDYISKDPVRAQGVR